MSREQVLLPDGVERPTEAEVVASTPEPSREVARYEVDGDVFRAMDAADEVQILDALQGKPSEVMVYTFRGSDGKPQSGLSWAGVAEAAREINQQGHGELRISKEFAPVVEEIQEQNEREEIVTSYRVMVYAEDARTGGGNYGMATQPKFQTYKDRSRKPTLDPFALTKALSKAQRNAILPLVPVAFREVLIAQRLGDEKRVKQIKMGAGAERAADLPVPLVDDRAQELRRDIKAAYDELKTVNRLALLPGQYQLKLEHAASSHVDLEALLGFMQALVAHERGESPSGGRDNG